LLGVGWRFIKVIRKQSYLLFFCPAFPRFED
jgi:hypothetical protein